MKIYTRLVLIGLILCSVGVGMAQNAIWIDEDFSDWSEDWLVYTDPWGDNGLSDIDFGKCYMHNDDQYLFIRFEVDEELILQGGYHETTLYLDTDNNANTGFSVRGIGAEIEYTLGQAEGRARINGTTYPLGHQQIGLIVAPTVSSTSFELGIRLNASVAGVSLFSGSTVRLLLEDDVTNGDLLPDENGGVAYMLTDDSGGDLPQYSLSRLDPSHLRVMSYNVLFDGLFENNKQVHFNRIFSAMEPDIIALQEVYDYTAQQAADQIGNYLPDTDWYYAKTGLDIILVSKYPILHSYFIPGTGGFTNGNGAFLVDLSSIGKAPVLIVNAHTPCCNNNGDRQLEIDAMMAFVREMKAGNGPFPMPAQTPIIICGDMNMVGWAAQKETLLTGDIVNQNLHGVDFAPDWDGSALEDAKPYVTNLPAVFTWKNDQSGFTPGRLDFMVYSGSVIELKNTFALYTPSLPAQEQLSFNLNGNDVPICSDHLPLIADFEVLISSIGTVSELQGIDLQLAPVPAREAVQLFFELDQARTLNIRLLNAEGKTVYSALSQTFREGSHQWSIQRNEWPGGMYFLQMQAEDGILTRKIVWE